MSNRRRLLTTTQIPYMPPEMIEHILKRSYSSTLQNCLEIKYLAEFAQKELDKRYQRCLEILIELGINEVEAKKQLAKVSNHPLHFLRFNRNVEPQS